MCGKSICPSCHGIFDADAGVNKCPFDETVLDELPSDSLIGTTIAERYKIVSLLGKGGMSKVYKARHLLIDRFVAIKLLHTHLATDLGAVKRFQQEARAASSLNHPNVITVYDFGITASGQEFLVMDFLDGESLSAYLARKQSFDLPALLKIFQQVCQGLASAHARGIVHRDIKPSNIMLVRDGTAFNIVKIVDFGIAKLVPAEGQDFQQLTQTGEIFGSPPYMSPEQCMGQKLDARSDIYSLGCVLYEALTGRPAFAGASSFETMNMHLNSLPLPFAEACPERALPPRLEEIVFKALAKDSQKRYQTVSALKDDLLAVESGTVRKLKATLPGRIASVQRQLGRKSRLIIKASLSLLAVIAVAGVTWLTCGPSCLHALWEATYSQGLKAMAVRDLAAAERAITLSAQISAAGKFQDETIKSLGKLVEILDREGQWVKAETYRAQLLSRKKARLSALFGDTTSELARFTSLTERSIPENPDKLHAQDGYDELLYRLRAIATLYVEKGDLDTGLRLFQKALALEEKLSSPDAPELSPSLDDVGVLYCMQGKIAEGKPFVERSLRNLENGGRQSTYEYVRVLMNSGRICDAEGKTQEAEQWFKRALKSAETNFGSSDARLIEPLKDYAGFLTHTGRSAEAAALEKRAAVLESHKKSVDLMELE